MTRTVTFRKQQFEISKTKKREGKNQIQVGNKNMIIREIIKRISLTQLVRYQKSKIKFLSCE